MTYAICREWGEVARNSERGFQPTHKMKGSRFQFLWIIHAHNDAPIKHPTWKSQIEMRCYWSHTSQSAWVAAWRKKLWYRLPLPSLRGQAVSCPEEVQLVLSLTKDYKSWWAIQESQQAHTRWRCPEPDLSSRLSATDVTDRAPLCLPKIAFSSFPVAEKVIYMQSLSRVLLDLDLI